MTAKAALCKHLLAGEVINVKTCFETIGLTNCAREVSRMIEKPFGVIVSRTRREGKSRYKQPVSWVDYRLNRTPHNAEGIKKMVKYVLEHEGKTPFNSSPKTDKEAKAKKMKFRGNDLLGGECGVYYTT